MQNKIIFSTRQSSCGKQQEVYRPRPNMAKRNLYLVGYPSPALGEGVTPVLARGIHVVSWTWDWVALPGTWYPLPGTWYPPTWHWGTPHLGLESPPPGVGMPPRKRPGTSHWATPFPKKDMGQPPPPLPQCWTGRHLWKQDLPSYYVRGR